MVSNVYDFKSGKVLFPNVSYAKGLGKLKGIVFKEKEFQTLVFDFGKTGRIDNAIHSLGCPDFYAVFLNKNKKVVEVLRVPSGQLFVLCNYPFRYLIECPVSCQKVCEKLLYGQELFF